MNGGRRKCGEIERERENVVLKGRSEAEDTHTTAACRSEARDMYGGR